MTARTECLAFAKVNGLQVKGDRQGIVAFNPSTNWVACFDGWNEAYAFFRAAVKAHFDYGAAYPWSVRRRA